jgi:hypothetical protein
MMDLFGTGTQAILISQLPIVVVLLYFGLVKKPVKAVWSIILGTLALTDFYIVAIDPSLVNALYLSQGDYAYPIEIAVFSAFLLLVAVGLFGKGVEDAAEEE